MDSAPAFGKGYWQGDGTIFQVTHLSSPVHSIVDEAFHTTTPFALYLLLNVREC